MSTSKQEVAKIAENLPSIPNHLNRTASSLLFIKGTVFLIIIFRANLFQILFWFASFQQNIKKINPCHPEKIKMPCPLLIFSQSDYLIQVVQTNSNI